MMGCVISSFSQLIFGVPSNLTPDVIDKNLGVFEVLSKESLELWLPDWSDVLWRRLYWAYLRLTVPRKKMAANVVQFILMASDVS